MEASALKYTGGIGLQGRSPLLRLQSDERLITLVRRGNGHAFEVLVARYQARLLAFCRHLLGSREDAEDVLQEVMTAAFNAMIADERAINVRPWLYRIARNRCLNHLRRTQAVGVDSMDIHLSDAGETTADKVHKAEEFRLLVGDIQTLPESQRTALVLREMDALSYEQIAEAMDTTVPSVKSLLVRARMSLAEAAQARQLSCEQVRIELAEVAEGLLSKTTPPVRRHLRSCQRCASFQTELKRTSRALAALLPLGPVALLKQLVIAHIGHSAGAGAGSSASATTSAGAAGAAVGSGAAAGGALVGAGGMMPIGIGALGVKAAAGLAAAALVTAGAVDLSHTTVPAHHHHLAAAVAHATAAAPAPAAPIAVVHHFEPVLTHRPVHRRHAAPAPHPAAQTATKSVPVKLSGGPTKARHTVANGVEHSPAQTTPGTTQSESISTVMSSGSNGSGTGTGATGTPATDGTQSSGSTTPPAPGSGTGDSGNVGIPLGDQPPSQTGTPTGTTTTPTPTPPPSDPGTGTPAPGTPVGGTPATGTPAPTGDPSTPAPGSGTTATGSLPVLGAPPA